VPELTVFFDGNCALCRSSAARVRRLDTRGRIELFDLHDPHPERFARIDREQAMRWMLAMDAAGRIYSGADAWARIGLLLPGWNLLAWILLVPGVHALARLAYGWIARNRYRLNRTTCADGACAVHRQRKTR
jgi:predicted DCC family thiol-disulfide oxidoreductase YuxK